jgi:hypothetical protein
METDPQAIRTAMRRIILLATLCTLAAYTPAQEAPAVVEFDPEYAHYYCQVRSGMLVQEVLKESKKRFPIGTVVDSTDLGPCVRECVGPVAMDPALRENGLREYCLFSGSNGILGQMIVLFVDDRRRVADLRVIAWGR